MAVVGKPPLHSASCRGQRGEAKQTTVPTPPAPVQSASFKPGSKVRIIGLKQKAHNGKEGVLGKWDSDTNRWEFKSGSTSIKVKEANTECIRHTPKTVLASRFFEAAQKFQYFDMVSNDHVFHHLYDMAADDTDGANLLFEQACNSEEMFDTLYQGCLK